jgi:hypothetical protein
MSPDAGWPHIANPLAITAEDHARHTERRGIPLPSDLLPGQKSTTMAKTALKFVNKPHSMPKRKATPRARHRKRRENG